MPGDAERLAADAVVVGSGAGGAPVAAVLAESGRRVVLLEAGPRLEAGDFTGDEGEMTARLWKLTGATDAVMTPVSPFIGTLVFAALQSLML